MELRAGELAIIPDAIDYGEAEEDAALRTESPYHAR